MVDLTKLRQISLSDKPYLESRIALRPSESCEASFANLIMWSRAYKTQIADWDGRAVVYNSTNRIIHFPLGLPPSPGELADLAKSFVSSGLSSDGFIYDIPPEYAGENAAGLAEHFEVSEHTDEFDYIYDLDHLIALEGHKLRKKRNLIRQFEEAHPDFQTEEITRENVRKAVEFAVIANARKEASPLFGGLYDEDAALVEAVKNFDALGLRGIMLHAEPGRPVGMALFSALNPEIWTVHFEKGDASVKGAPQKLAWLEAVELKRLGASRMNREQDLGVENMRRAKESLDPSHMYRRHFAKLRP